MDVGLLIGAVRRRYRLVLLGAALALVLASLSYGTVVFDGGLPKLNPRGTEKWQAESQLLITQEGFPYGRAVPRFLAPGSKDGTPAIEVGDQARLAALSPIYASLFNSDGMRAALAADHPPAGSVLAEPVADPNSGVSLPLVTLTAEADSDRGARALASRSSDVFEAYVARQQAQAGTENSARVQLDTLKKGDSAVMLSGPDKTLPALVFLAVLMATAGLVLVLENVRPRRSSELTQEELSELLKIDKQRQAA
jgi:hypothetical protein